VMGGYDGSRKNDVWWSTDGITWTQATASAGWSGRHGHTSVVYDGKMWVMGGTDGSYKRDVWRSTDGIPVIQCTNPAPPNTLLTFSTPLDYYNFPSYQWNFGDGQTATGTNPTHTYTDAGTYTVSITMPDEVNGMLTTYSETVEIVEAPTANFTANTTAGLSPLTVQFTDSSTGDPASWAWQFGDGQTATTQNPVHTYDAAGIYSVNLTVTNAYGTDSLVKNITVDIHLPIADFDCNPVLGAAPLTVTFTDESEFLPYQWFWQFGDGVTSTVQHPTHTYTEPGTYTVSLRSSNAVGSDTMTKTDVITVQLPTIDFTASPTMGGSPLTVQFTTDGSPDWSYHWSFGDGATSNEQNPTHVYKTTQDQQFYTVSLTVAYGGEEQEIVKPNYIDVRTKSVETFMAEQQENIGGVVTIGAVMATIAGIIVIYLGL